MEVLQLILNGLMAGTILAVPAIGLTAIFAVLRFTNFALASHITIGAFAGFVANVDASACRSCRRWLCAFLVAGLVGVADRRVRAEAVPRRRLHHHRHRLDRAHHRARERRPLRLRQRAARLRPADPARLGVSAACASGRSRSRTSSIAVVVMALLFAFLVLHAHRQGDARGRRQSRCSPPSRASTPTWWRASCPSSAWGSPGSAAC